MPDATSQTPVPPEPEIETRVREVVGLFPDVGSVEHAVEELLTSGFDHGDMSLLAGERSVREKLGHRLDDTLAAADDPEAPRRSWIEPESRMEGRGALAAMLGYLGAVTALGVTFATGGAAAPAIAAALVGAGAGAGLGAGLGKIYDQRLADEFRHQIDKGGILLWVRCRNDACESRAQTILSAHGAHHVHAHSLPPIDHAS